MQAAKFHESLRRTWMTLSLILVAACALVMTACIPVPMRQAVSAVSAPPATIAPPPSAPSATIAPPSAAQIYRQLSQSVAFIDVPGGTGSGVLVDDGYVVTNAHVVWPYDVARVVFANGEEYLDVPVQEADQLADLAVLGPIDTALPPVPLTSGEHFEIGEDVYLIGYPGEGERFPQPALSRGIISRKRQWAGLDITYFQSDAAIAGGQSGGMFVSREGEVIGISGFHFADRAFALVASAADLLPRVERLIAGEDVDELPARDLLRTGRRSRVTFLPLSYYDQQMYLINEAPGTEVEITAQSEGEVFIGVVDIFGEYVVDESGSGKNRDLTSSFRVRFDAPYFVVVGMTSEPVSEITVRASHRLLAFDDPDDDALLEVGATRTGQIDYATDVDFFVLSLEAGQSVTITVDAIGIDPYITVDARGGRVRDILSDDDSGGGLFGINAQLRLDATRTDDYYVIVEDAVGYDVGGYLIRVEDANLELATE